MKGVLLIVVVSTACATSGVDERPQSMPSVSCTDSSLLSTDPACHLEGVLRAAELAEKQRTDNARLIAEARGLIDGVRDPYARAYFRMRVALLDSNRGGPYKDSIAQARADALLIFSSSERRQVQEHIQRTDQACTLRAADYLIRTP